MQKLDPKDLPDLVNAAYTAAEAWLQERFRGRRVIPKSMVVSMPIPDVEHDADAKLYAVLVPVSGDARARIGKAVTAVQVAKERGSAAALEEAADQLMSLLLVEGCFWVGGLTKADGSPDQMPAPRDPKDPRPAARDYLKELRSEPGALGTAYDQFASMVLKGMEAPEVRLGKL